MKPFIPFALLCALATSTAPGAVTDPVGYETITLEAGIEYQLAGLRLLESAVVPSGELTGVNGMVLSDSEVNFDTLLQDGTTYIFEITSGAGAGMIQEVTSWGTGSGNTANDFVVPQDLSGEPANLAAGDTYVLRPAAIIEDYFDETVLKPGFVSGSADLLWVPDGMGDYTKYFVSSLDGNPIKNAATNADVVGAPLVYTDGILIQKRADSPESEFVVSGEVKLTSTMSMVGDGTPSSPSYNLLSTVYPAGATLANSGLGASLTSGFTAGQADLVWVPDGSGGYVKYFVSSLAGNPWKNASTNADVDATTIELTPGVLVERKGEAVNILLTPPESYGDL